MAPNPYFFIVIFVGVALAFPLLPLALAWLWRKVFQPPKPGAEKNAIYECGVESISGAVCGRVHWFAGRGVHRDSGFLVAAN